MWKRILMSSKEGYDEARGRTFIPYVFDDNDLYAYKVIIDHKKRKDTWRKYGQMWKCILMSSKEGYDESKR